MALRQKRPKRELIFDPFQEALLAEEKELQVHLEILVNTTDSDIITLASRQMHYHFRRMPKGVVSAITRGNYPLNCV